MEKLWKYIDQKAWTAAVKYKICLLILGILFALIGGFACLISGIFVHLTWDWTICFIGYPVIFSWFLVFFYSCRHDFHDGITEK